MSNNYLLEGLINEAAGKSIPPGELEVLGRWEKCQEAENGQWMWELLKNGKKYISQIINWWI